MKKLKPQENNLKLKQKTQGFGKICTIWKIIKKCGENGVKYVLVALLFAAIFA